MSEALDQVRDLLEQTWEGDDGRAGKCLMLALAGRDPSLAASLGDAWAALLTREQRQVVLAAAQHAAEREDAIVMSESALDDWEAERIAEAYGEARAAEADAEEAREAQQWAVRASRRYRYRIFVAIWALLSNWDRRRFLNLIGARHG